MLSIIDILPTNVVIVESDLGNEKSGFQQAHNELGSPEARKWVLTEAAKQGLVAKSFGYTHGAPYPVDANGDVIADGGQNGQPIPPIHRYRRDFQLNP